MVSSTSPQSRRRRQLDSGSYRFRHHGPFRTVNAQRLLSCFCATPTRIVLVREEASSGFETWSC